MGAADDEALLATAAAPAPRAAGAAVDAGLLATQGVARAAGAAVDAGLLATQAAPRAAGAAVDAGLLATQAAARAPTDAGLLATTAATAPHATGLDAAAMSAVPMRAVAASATADHAGRTLGRYRLIERLGAGAMGVVYRATDQEFGRDVALKLLHAPDADLTDRLVREARAMAQVSHPNVVAVYDVGVIDGLTYIAICP